MQELRLVAVSEDGTYLVLASAGRGTRFMLPVDDRLRAAVRGQFSRLGQYEIEVENPLRPKEIQARIRSGETAEAISEAAGIPIERVRWFEGPVLQEREYMAQQAQRATVRRQGESTPGPTLGDLVTERIGAHQLETGDAVWDAWKREDTTWQLRLSFIVHGEERAAHWTFEPRRRSVAPLDEEADRFFGGADPGPAELGPASANVTPFAPRRQGADPAGRPAEPPRAQELRARELWPQEPRQRERDDLWPQERDQRPAARTDTPTAPPARPEPAAPQYERPAQRSESTGQRHPAAPALPGRAAPGRAPITPQRADPARAPERHEPPARPERRERPTMQPAMPPKRQAPPAAARQDDPADTQDSPMPAAAAGGATPAAPEQPRRKGRGRRASVPSWDEIMFGSKKSD